MEAVEDLRRNTSTETRMLITHDLPIPDAQNEITSRALALGCSAILYIEEDVIPPEDFLDHATADMVQTVDYALEGGNHSVHLDDNNDVIFCGMGCLLVAADVFRKLPRPWFHTKSHTTIRDGHKELLVPQSELKHYGGQEVALCFALQQAGIPIHLLTELRAKHLRVKRMGTPKQNDGCHEIEFL
jgi:hypothetical protein